MADVVINIITGHESRAVVGADSLVFPLPDMLYLDVGQHHTLLAQPLGKLLRTQSEENAARLGEILHHAEWTITTNPAVVEAKGNMHDCEECRAGTRRVLRYLREHPGKEMCVGVLYWAAP